MGSYNINRSNFVLLWNDEILTGKELEFMELARIITVFVMGFVLLIVGIISIQNEH